MQQPYNPYYGQPGDGPAPGVRWGSRFGRLIAYWVDGFILALVLGLFFGIAGGVTAVAAQGDSSPLAIVSLVLMVVGLVVGIAWKPWFWTHGGQTPGYKLLGLKVVRQADGGPITGGQAVGRLLSYIVSAIFYLGFIWILFDAKRQGWHDKLANTVVIAA